MKYVLILLVCSLVLSGCGVEFGQNYNHLQNQDLTKRHEVDVTGDTNRNVNGDSAEKDLGVFEALNNNLCNIHPECCGQFTEDQKKYIAFEELAIDKLNKDACYQLPTYPLVIRCGNDFNEEVIVYSRERCLDYFS